MGWRPDLSKVVKTGKRVAVIGAGPRALPVPTCWHAMASPCGVRQVPGDRRPAHLRYPLLQAGERGDAAPPRDLRGDGVEFRLETEVGRDVTFADLLGEFDAVFLGVGTYKYMKGGFANEEAPGSTTPCPTSSPTPIACWALRRRKPTTSTSPASRLWCWGRRHRHGLRAHRHPPGADRVICAYRRDAENMPGSKREVKTPRRKGWNSCSTSSPSAWSWTPTAAPAASGGEHRARRPRCQWPPQSCGH